ncbi:MAG: hypothetical protein ACE5FU_02825, partial [Nitrospinota bacterium]
MKPKLVKKGLTKRPKMLLLGMPGAHSSFFEMNIAQLPQGPLLRPANSFPKRIKEWVNTPFINIFNPNKKAPYMGLRLIEQNVSRYVDFKILEYPEGEGEILGILKRERDIDCIGISIGCENRVYQAKELSATIRRDFPGVNIIFGNYGAVAGKKLKILTPEDGMVLWDNEQERETKKGKNQDFYSGEGVHDVRLWFKENGVNAGDPNTPLFSRAIPDPDIFSQNRLARWLMEKTGFIPMPNDQNKIGVSIGCTNNCSFCNTRFKFNRSKTYLYRKAEDIFHEMERVHDLDCKNPKSPPESLFFLMDENFMKDEMVKSGVGQINFLEIAERLCHLIEHSGKNIHWGTFSDVKSLLGYTRRKGSFAGLVRGGLQSVWIGLESKEDVFNKRGGASTKEVEEMIAEVQSFGISIIGSFIPGLSIHTESPSVRRFDTLREFRKSIEEKGAHELDVWFHEKKEELLKVFYQVLCYSPKGDLVKAVEGMKTGIEKSAVLNVIRQHSKNADSKADHTRGVEESILSALQHILLFSKEKFLKMVEKVLTLDKYEKLNIWEDVDWWIKQKTGCRQVMMYSITGVVGNHNYMLRL